MFSVRFTEESVKRELAERFKAASLSLAKGKNFHMFESYTLWKIKQVSVRWLVASFGLEIFYVRIIITWDRNIIKKISYNIDDDMYYVHLEKSR